MWHISSRLAAPQPRQPQPTQQQHLPQQKLHKTPTTLHC
jgi:hypothetical protein